MAVSRRGPRVSERVEQQHIVTLLRTLGATVYVLGTVRKHGDHQGTMQTPGLPDVLAFLPPHKDEARPQRHLLAVEVKAQGGRLQPAQIAFRELCLVSGIDHVVGTADTLIAWLIKYEYLRSEQVPHYRLPAAQEADA